MSPARFESTTFVCMKVTKFLLLLCIGLGIALFSLPASAQLNYGRIYGSVTDQTGGAVAGATVTVIDVDRGISRALAADDTGQYSAPSLLPGNYSVRAEFKGFKVAEHSGLTVGVGQDVRVDLSLQPGEQTQTVTVTGEVPMVNTTSATLGATVENATIVDLPLNGRAFQKLLDFNPGMQQIPGGGTPAYNANGQRGTNITWMLDGVDEINMAGGAGPTVGGNGGGVDGVTILSLDSIQEINTIQSPKAEYGWMAGSVVNVGLKSGTNNVHGTAFGFLRNGDLDARNAFLSSTLSKANDDLKQYGATIGGPFKKDKIFYFGAYEGNRYTLGAPKTITEPTDTSGPGTTNSIPDAIAAMNAIAGQKISTMSVLMAGCTAGAINPALKTGAQVAPFCGPGATGAPPSLFGNSSASSTEAVQFNNQGGSDNGLAKLDYHLNDKSTLNGEYFFGNGNVDNATSAVSPYWLADNHFRTQTGRVVWVWTPKSSLVNEMRFGLLEYTQLGFPDDCNGNDGAPNYSTAYGYNLGLSIPAPQCGMGSVVITGFNNLGSQSTNGGPQANHFSVWSGIDSLSYTRGNHLFKFGGEIHDTLFSGSKSLTNDNGTFNFGRTNGLLSGTGTPLEDFLAGAAASGTIQVGNATLSEPVHYNRYALFAQDDWRIRPRITVNLGVRWEYVQPIYTPNNVLGNFNAGAATGLVQETGGSSVYALPKDLFSPRLGIAWDVTGKGTTVVRLGGTYMYDFLVFQQLLPNLQAVPTGFALVLPNGTLAPQPGNNLLGTLALSTAGVNWTGTGPVVALSPNPANSLGFACGNGLAAFNGTTPVPCNLTALTPPTGFQPDKVTAWNLSVQHAFTRSISLNAAYVGTHGSDLRGTTDLNQPQLGIANGTSGAALENEQSRRIYTQNCPATFQFGQGLNPAQCFPYLGQVLENLPNEISNYNGLQMTLTDRLSHGLQFTAGYTYAHALDEASGVSNSANSNLENTQNPALDYGNAAFDARHHFTITATYDIPGYKTKGQMLQGWQLNVALSMLSALPFNAQDSTDDLSGTGIDQDRWNILGSPSNITAGTAAPIPCFGVAGSAFAKTGTGCTIVQAGTGALGTPGFVSNLPAQCVSLAQTNSISDNGLWDVASNPTVAVNHTQGATNGSYNGLAALGNLGCYLQNGTAIAPGAQGTYGDMGRDALRGQAFRETDLSVTKSWKFKENMAVQFRAEFFNIFNAVEFSNPGQSTATANLAAPATFGSSSSTPNTFSFIFGSGGPRTAQLGLKFLF
jgi:hypothetical protein